MFSTSLRDIGYRNERLTDILHSYVLKQKSQLNVFFLSLVINSYASLYPEKMKYFNDLATELHEKLQIGLKPETLGKTVMIEHPGVVYDYIPDITTYSNLWLALTCFGIKQNINL